MAFPNQPRAAVGEVVKKAVERSAATAQCTAVEAHLKAFEGSCVIRSGSWPVVFWAWRKRWVWGPGLRLLRGLSVATSVRCRDQRGRPCEEEAEDGDGHDERPATAHHVEVPGWAAADAGRQEGGAEQGGG